MGLFSVFIAESSCNSIPISTIFNFKLYHLAPEGDRNKFFCKFNPSRFQPSPSFGFIRSHSSIQFNFAKSKIVSHCHSDFCTNGLIQEDTNSNSFSMSIDNFASTSENNWILFSSTEDAKKKFNGVLVAGTFDRFHKGHSLLLNAAISSLNSKGLLTIGLTDGKLIENKYLSLLIEPFATRKRIIEKFIHDHCKKFNLDMNETSIRFVSINERYPQSGLKNELLEAIVVSEETKKEAMEFNKRRKELGLAPLHVILVDVVLENEQNEKKLSSSELRECDLGTFLSIPEEENVFRTARKKKSKLNFRPYRIGLTGNIASGKSTVAKMLSNFGAKFVDCDSLAHKCYFPGTASYFQIIESFGGSVLNEDKSVDRAALGKIVFSNPEEMKKLTGIVWPRVADFKSEIFDDMSAKILSESSIHSPATSAVHSPASSPESSSHTAPETQADDEVDADVEICVAEAAMIIESQSFVDFDEIWFVFASNDIACERLRKRNGLTMEEAGKRINSQMHVSEKIKYADVAIYNGKDLDFLHRQVSKAWNLLRHRFKQRLVEFYDAKTKETTQMLEKHDRNFNDSNFSNDVEYNKYGEYCDDDDDDECLERTIVEKESQVNEVGRKRTGEEETVEEKISEKDKIVHRHPPPHHYVRMRFYLLCERLNVDEKNAKMQWMMLLNEYKNNFDDVYTFLEYIKSIYTFFHEYFYFIAFPQMFELSFFFLFVSKEKEKRKTFFQKFLSSSSINVDSGICFDLLNIDLSNNLNSHLENNLIHQNDEYVQKFWLSDFLLAALVNLEDEHFFNYFSFLANKSDSTKDIFMKLLPNECKCEIFKNSQFILNYEDLFRDKLSRVMNTC